MKEKWPAELGFSLILTGAVCLLGCSSSVPTNTGANPIPPATVAYAWGVSEANGNPLTILEYSTGSGVVTGTLTLPSGFTGTTMATDSRGYLYVPGIIGNTNAQVLIYPPKSTGAATPSRTIDIPNSDEPNLLAVSPTNLVYVITGGWPTGSFVSVYSADASGFATPLRTVQVNTTDTMLDLAADAAGNIYIVRWPTFVINNLASYIEIYSPDASGSPAAPTRTITSSSFIFGITVDTQGNVLANACQNAVSCAIQEFSPTAAGAATPFNTINLPQAAGMDNWGGFVQLDGADNIFATECVRNPSTDVVTFTIYEFGPTATSNAVPMEQIVEETPLREFAIH